MSSRIDSVTPRLRWDVLSPVDVERIHEAGLAILEAVGVRFPSEKALDVLEAGGCAVDRATSMVRLPRSVVMGAVAEAPREYLLAGRDPACDMWIDLRRCHLTNDGSGVFVQDPRTGRTRSSTKTDVAESARFIDALPAVACCWGPAVTSQDSRRRRKLSTTRRPCSPTRASTSRRSRRWAKSRRGTSSRWRLRSPAGRASSASGCW